MISHVEAEALISARLDQPLDPIAERELAAHLATCPRCRAFAHASDTLAMGLRQLPYLPPSPAVSRGVRARIDEGRSPWAPFGGFGGILNTSPGPAFSTFAIIAVLFLLGFFVLNRFVLDERDAPSSGNNQLAAQPTEPATRRADYAPPATVEPTDVPTATATSAPAVAPISTTAPTATSEPPTNEPAPTDVPTATEVPPTDVPAPTATAPPVPTIEPTQPPTNELEPTQPPASMRRSVQKSTPSDIVDLISPPASTTDEATATPYQEPTATLSPTATTEPTATVAPTATATVEPTATATPKPTEEGPPPILPIDGGQVIEGPDEDGGETPAATIEEAGFSPTATPPGDSGENNVRIEPIGGTGPVESTESGDEAGKSTPAATDNENAIQPLASETVESTEPTATEIPESEDDGTHDLDSQSEPYGNIAGEPGGRLILDDGKAIFAAQDHPASLTALSGLEAQAVSTDSGQAVAICAPGGDCTDLSSESSGGAAVDEPLGWIDGGVIYVRNENNTISYHYLESDESGTEVLDDVKLYDGGLDLLPTEPVYRAGGRIWVITTGGDWLTLSPDGAQRLPNSHADPHDPRFADTSDRGFLVGYVSSSQLIVSPAEAPGSPILTLPYSAVDFDIAPSGNRVVVSTGEAIEIYDMSGTLIASYASGGTTPGTVLWLNSGIVYVDTASGVLMQLLDPVT